MSESARANSLRGRLRGAMLPLVRVAARVDPTAALVMLAILAAITLIAVETPIAVTRYGLPLVLAFPLAVVHAGALPLAVAHPLVASILAAAASAALQFLGAHPENGVWPWWPVLIVTHTLLVFVVAVRTRWPFAVAGWTLAVGSSSLVAGILGKAATDGVSRNQVIFVSISGGVLIGGIVLAQWQRIRGQLLRARQVSAEEYSRRVLAEDRARIARELHDVVAHSMSLINIQASTARYRNPQLNGAAVGEFDEIATASRQALSEMRGLLGVLRADDVGGELSPQPGLSDIPELVEQAQRAGMDVRLAAPVPEHDDVSSVVGLTAYRIVQEALTNALRHAPGAPAVVACIRDGDSLSVSVQNGPGISLRASGGSRLGLIGMAERAASVGGFVSAAPTADGGFLVRAALPVRGEGTGGER
ncbi:sensor histidine kinase [Naasia sp. SYSU D00948]|uniref:sensor histidine kinase n=1 Tax=Naasia sp. SYSU D00948 TaxID=2817379 RepID=UPI001B30B2A6|nr:histidine kinase [Naasia sp. SYSU D00948]